MMDGAERRSLFELGFDENTENDFMNHNQILNLINEIKGYEQKYPEFYLGGPVKEEGLIEINHDSAGFVDIESGSAEFIDVSRSQVEFVETKPDLVEFIDLEKGPVGEVGPVEFQDVTDSSKPVEGTAKRGLFKIKARSSLDVRQAMLERKVATFRLRFDKNGKLVNLDIKKSKRPKSKKGSKEGLKSKIPKIRGKEKTADSEPAEKKSKKELLKGGLSKISKLKNVIPTRGKEDTSKEETKSE